jgi:RNA polymerase sigma factor (sigma-70 family)
MTSRPTAAVLPHLRRLFAGNGDGPSDPQLLERFLARRDEDAFAALVRRHGPMVFAVCRRLLPDPHDAEDAFQATFLVLVRKARSLGRPERLGNWLYGVACRTAMKARGHNARRRQCEQPLADVPTAGGVAELVWRELRPVLDEELNRLPEKYRTPVVLCCLEGVSKREAARRLGWPAGTLSTRLHRAREILRGRLTRRGLALSAGVVAVALSRGTVPAAVPTTLAAATATAASRIAAGQAAAVPAPVLALAEGVLRAMWWNKLKVAAAALLAAVLLAAGIGGAMPRTPAAAPEAEAKAPAAAPADEAPKKDEAEPKTFRLGKDVAKVVWSPDGKLMASRATRFEKKADGNEGQLDWLSAVKVWDAVTGKEIVSLGELKNSGLVDLCFSPDGATLALSFSGRIEEGAKIELWDARKGELKKTIEMDYGRVAPRLVFTPDGKAVVALYAGDTGRDPKAEDLQGGVRLFDVAKGKAIRSVRGHKHMAICAAFSPDGKLLATGGYTTDSDVRLWDVATGKELRVIAAGAIVPAVAFSPDGKVVAGGQGDGRVVLWDVATGKELRALKGATDSTSALAFSPDGRLLAAAGSVEKGGKRADEARLWDLRTGELLRSWKDTATSLAFTPDGKALAILGKDGTVRLWELKAAEAAAPADDYGFGTLIDQLIKEKKTDEQAAEALYLAAMGRFPAERERKLLTDHLAKKKDRRDALIDVVWSLINTKEYWAHLDALNSHDPRKMLRK